MGRANGDSLSGSGSSPRDGPGNRCVRHQRCGPKTQIVGRPFSAIRKENRPGGGFHHFSGAGHSEPMGFRPSGGPLGVPHSGNPGSLRESGISRRRAGAFQMNLQGKLAGGWGGDRGHRLENKNNEAWKQKGWKKEEKKKLLRGMVRGEAREENKCVIRGEKKNKTREWDHEQTKTQDFVKPFRKGLIGASLPNLMGGWGGGTRGWMGCGPLLSKSLARFPAIGRRAGSCWYFESPKGTNTKKFVHRLGWTAVRAALYGKMGLKRGINNSQRVRQQRGENTKKTNGHHHD